MLEIDVLVKQDAFLARGMDIHQVFMRGLEQLRASIPPGHWRNISAEMHPAIANILVRDTPVLDYGRGEYGARLSSYCGVPVTVRYDLGCWFQLWVPYTGNVRYVE